MDVARQLNYSLLEVRIFTIQSEVHAARLIVSNGPLFYAIQSHANLVRNALSYLLPIILKDGKWMAIRAG